MWQCRLDPIGCAYPVNSVYFIENNRRICRVYVPRAGNAALACVASAKRRGLRRSGRLGPWRNVCRVPLGRAIAIAMTHSAVAPLSRNDFNALQTASIFPMNIDIYVHYNFFILFPAIITRWFRLVIKCFSQCCGLKVNNERHTNWLPAALRHRRHLPTTYGSPSETRYVGFHWIELTMQLQLMILSMNVILKQVHKEANKKIILRD